jgi:starch synthase
MTSSALEVLSVASEVFPLIKTGGLADVAGALPAALAPEGVHVRTLLPGYPGVAATLSGGEAVHDYAELFGGPAKLLGGRAHGLDLLVLDAPHLYARDGGPYTDAAGRDWADNPLRFAALARAAADIAGGGPGWRPSVVHAHDWQAGLLPAYLHYDARDGRRRPPCVFTIHNLAFQGQCDAGLLARLGLPPDSYSINGVEYYGAIGYLKAGLLFADRITTVSPGYAAEICLPDSGMGLDGLLRGRADALLGILNGLDDVVWNPATDPLLAARFAAGELAGRTRNRAELQARLGLQPDPDALLFGVVSRLTWQKGCDLLAAVVPELLAEGAQLALIGAGDPAMEAALRAAAAGAPGRIGCHFGYDEPLAHLLHGGVDALLVPSRFEPCGLTQLSALRYGAVPVVARVGGLADTVIDANPMALAAGVATGVQFAPVNAEMLEGAIRRTTRLFRDRAAWARLQDRGMACDVSWRDPARRYAALYRELAAAA